MSRNWRFITWGEVVQSGEFGYFAAIRTTDHVTALVEVVVGDDGHPALRLARPLLLAGDPVTAPSWRFVEGSCGRNADVALGLAAAAPGRLRDRPSALSGDASAAGAR